MLACEESYNEFRKAMWAQQKARRAAAAPAGGAAAVHDAGPPRASSSGDDYYCSGSGGDALAIVTLLPAQHWRAHSVVGTVVLGGNTVALGLLAPAPGGGAPARRSSTGGGESHPGHAATGHWQLALLAAKLSDRRLWLQAARGPLRRHRVYALGSDLSDFRTTVTKASLGFGQYFWTTYDKEDARWM